MQSWYWLGGLVLFAWIVRGAMKGKPKERGQRIDVGRHIASVGDAGEEIQLLPDDESDDEREDFAVAVKGASKYQANLKRIAGPKEREGKNHPCVAALILEDTNAHDPKAVRVDINGLTVGYLAREDAVSYRRKLKVEKLGKDPLGFRALVVGGWFKTKAEQGHYGVRIDIDL